MPTTILDGETYEDAKARRFREEVELDARRADSILATQALARQAVRLYPRTSYTDRKAVNTLRRGWIRQIQYLGDKWLLAQPVPRKQAGHAGDMAALLVAAVGALIAGIWL